MKFSEGFVSGNNRATAFRDEEETNAPILLVFESVCGVASIGTDNQYAPIEAPCKRIQIRRNTGTLVSSSSLNLEKDSPYDLKIVAQQIVSRETKRRIKNESRALF